MRYSLQTRPEARDERRERPRTRRRRYGDRRDRAYRTERGSRRRFRVTRRSLQIVLAALWLLDGALQLQPFMLGTGFARQIVEPAASGQPHLVAASIRWAANVIAAHPVAWDLAFAGTQLLLGLGMLFPRTTRPALAASLPWALGVWFFGEGLGGLPSGDASLLTGAPGSVLLYGVVAIVAWPREGRSDLPPARRLPLAWAAVWLVGAILQALPANDTGAAVAGAIAAGSDGAPHWLARLDTSVAGWIARNGVAVVVALVAVEALVGLVALHRRGRTLAVGVGLLLTLPIWIVGQDLGQLYTGQATDPNTAPLLALIAVALLFAVKPPSTTPSPAGGADAGEGERVDRLARRVAVRHDRTVRTASRDFDR